MARCEWAVALWAARGPGETAQGPAREQEQVAVALEAGMKQWRWDGERRTPPLGSPKRKIEWDSSNERTTAAAGRGGQSLQAPPNFRVCDEHFFQHSLRSLIENSLLLRIALYRLYGSPILAPFARVGIFGPIHNLAYPGIQPPTLAKDARMGHPHFPRYPHYFLEHQN